MYFTSCISWRKYLHDEHQDNGTASGPLPIDYFSTIFLQRDQREALRVLSELKSVIAIRALETSERERSALLRQNPDYKFDTKDDEKSRPTLDSSDQTCERRRLTSDDKASVPDQDAVNRLEQLSNETCAMSDVSCSFSKHVAMLATAKSKQMASLPVETFGSDSEDSYTDDSQSDSDGSGTGR